VAEFDAKRALSRGQIIIDPQPQAQAYRSTTVESVWLTRLEDSGCD
jgi:hypothetical protein